MTQKSKNFFGSGVFMTLLIVLLLVADQVIKVLVKTNMTLHESIEIASWFKILFIENNGMAFGMEIGSKVVLSLFRIVAVGFICYYLRRLVRQGARTGYMICVAMVLAGAAGNIFDSLFYGQIFSASTPYTLSELVPFGEGYAPVLMGKVVDMFYFPLIVTTYPDWVPVVGGDEFIFFSPVFNFADSCVSVGVVAAMLFYREELGTLFGDDKKKDVEEKKKDDKDNSENTADTAAV